MDPEALAVNRWRSAIMVGVLYEPELVDVVRANVARLAAERGLVVELGDDPTLAEVERAAEALGVAVLELLVAGC